MFVSALLSCLSTFACAKNCLSKNSRMNIDAKFNSLKLGKPFRRDKTRNKYQKSCGQVPKDVKKLKSDINKKPKMHKVGKSLVRHITREKVKKVFNMISNGLVDNFAEKPLSSTLKYVVAPPSLMKLFSVVINEIYNHRHFPSRMKTEYLMYLLEHGYKCPKKEELKEYVSKKFVGGVYQGDWETKKMMIDHLTEILITNYLIAPQSEVVNQVGYGVVDTFLFRSARDRIEIASKRFLNNKGGSCISIACYLLTFMEKLGIEARLAFNRYPKAPLDAHACLVYKEDGKEGGKWKKMDLCLRFALKADDQSLDKKYIGEHLLVLEKIKKDDKRKFTGMKCAKIVADGKPIDEFDIDSLEYKYKIPFVFNW